MPQRTQFSKQTDVLKNSGFQIYQESTANQEMSMIENCIFVMIQHQIIEDSELGRGQYHKFEIKRIMDSCQKLTMNCSLTRKNSLSASSQASTATQNITSLRQNAERILQNCEQTLEELLKQSDLSNYSVEELFVLISQHYGLRQSEIRQMGKLLSQAIELIEQQTADKCSLAAQIDKDHSDHKHQISYLTQTLKDYRLQIRTLKQKLQQTQLDLLETQQHKNSLHDLYEQSLLRRTSLTNNLPYPQQSKKCDEPQLRMLEVTLLEVEVKQLRSELEIQEGVISQKEIAKGEMGEQIRELKVRVRGLEKQNIGLRDTVEVLEHRVGELEAEIMELNKMLERHAASSQKLDFFMETKVTEDDELERVDIVGNNSVCQSNFQGSAAVNKQTKLSLKIELQTLNFSNPQISSDRSVCSRYLHYYPQNKDSNEYPSLPLISVKSDPEKETTQNSPKGPLDTFFGRLKAYFHYIQNYSVNKRVHRQRIGNFCLRI